MIEDTIENN